MTGTNIPRATIGLTGRPAWFGLVVTLGVYHIVTSQREAGVNQVNYAEAASAFRGVLTELQTAQHLEADGENAARVRRGSREHLNYSLMLENPRQRLSERLPIYPAIARVVWMMSANNRLADIAFHEPRVKAFTDDDLTVPGSSYGMRLRQPQPGLGRGEDLIILGS